MNSNLRKTHRLALSFLLAGAGFPAWPAGAGQTNAPASTSFGPLPRPSQTANAVHLSTAEQLGKDIFFDATLSHPSGYSCATCHLPAAGFTSPSSPVNEYSGPVPGVVPGRFGHRKPQAVAYSAFSPEGPYFDTALQVYLGGNFWDGRAADSAAQARMPFLDPDEMANVPVGPLPPPAGGYSPLVAEKLQKRPYTALFERIFGAGVFQSATDEELFTLATAAIEAYERSGDVNPFSSKYDASQYGMPPFAHYRLTAAEENGRALFFGAAQCSQCHSSAGVDSVQAVTLGKQTFTMYCYANIGVPANPQNPVYSETNFTANPNGSNPLGAAFIDFGLGANPNPSPDGARFMVNTPGDIPAFRGLFKAPSVRNVDLRPHQTFVKSYMHNGVFKSLEEVVHFYNKRNIAVNAAGAEVAFSLLGAPPAGYTPLFAPPEVLENVQNVVGASPAEAGNFIFNNGQVGNLGLTAQQEADLVSFLRILSDGFMRPHPIGQ